MAKQPDEPRRSPRLVPVEGNPFAAKAPPKLTPVDFDPFAAQAPNGRGGTPARAEGIQPDHNAVLTRMFAEGASREDIEAYRAENPGLNINTADLDRAFAYEGPRSDVRFAPEASKAPPVKLTPVDFNPFSERAPQPTDVSVADSFDRGMAGLRTTLNLLPFALEAGAKAVIGQENVAAANEWFTDTLGGHPDGARGVLADSFTDLNAAPRDETLVRAGQRYEEAPGFLSGVAAGAGEIASNPGSLVHMFAELAPSLPLGGLGMKGAQVAAWPVIERAALKIGARAATTGRVSAGGAGFNTGLTIANAGQNAAAQSAEPGMSTEEAARLGVAQTAGQIPGSAAAGALVPVAPFKGVSGAIPNSLVQAGIQGAGQVASVLGGNEVIGRDTSDAEKFVAGASGLVLGPVDVAVRVRAARKARAEQMEAEYAQRRKEASGEAAAARYSAFSEAPARSEGGWAETADGVIAGADGNPVAFRTAKDAARFAVDNELAGEFDIASGPANGERVVLRRRPRSDEATAPADEAATATPADAEAGRAGGTPVPEAGGERAASGTPAQRDTGPAKAPVARSSVGDISDEVVDSVTEAIAATPVNPETGIVRVPMTPRQIASLRAAGIVADDDGNLDSGAVAALRERRIQPASFGKDEATAIAQPAAESAPPVDSAPTTPDDGAPLLDSGLMEQATPTSSGSATIATPGRFSMIAESDLEPRVPASGEGSQDATGGRLAPATGVGPSPRAPDFAEASFTNRTSIYDTAARDIGFDPDKFRLLPAPRQLKLLRGKLKEAFGVDVSTAPGMQDRFAIDQMLDAYQNVQGMAHVLGLPAGAISLEGRLKLQLQKNARFLGSYQPAAGTITLPGRSNSFAHEWGHALDYYLLDRLGDGAGKGFSGALRQRGNRMPDGELAPSRNVREAFVDLLNAMFFDEAGQAAKIMDLERRIAATKSDKQRRALTSQLENIRGGSSQSPADRTAFYRNAKEFDGPTGEHGKGEYWQSPTEMLARAFEAYVSMKVEMAGLTTEFLGKGDHAYLSNADERFAKTFPKEGERERIFAALDAVFARIAEEALLGNGSAARPDAGATFRVTDLDKVPALDRHGSLWSRMIEREMSAVQDFLVEQAKKLANRPKNPQGVLEKAQDVISYVGYGMTARMKMIARRHKSPAIKRLHDMLTHNTGSSSLTQRTYLQAVDLRTNKALNRLDNILKAHGPKQKLGTPRALNAAESRIVRDLLISADVPNAPANLVKAASAMRKLMDEVFYDLQKAGIDVGYSRNGYLPRMIDRPKIDENPQGFVAQAERVYEAAFDQEFGTDAATLAADPEKLAELLKRARALSEREPSLAEPRQAVATILKRLKKLGEGEDVSTLEAALATALEPLMEATRAAYARQAAIDWLLRIKTAAPDEVDKQSANGSFTKSRTLPPEADKLMGDFYISEPVELVSAYLKATSRRIEFAQRFGADSAKLKAVYEEMAAEGVPARAVEEIQTIVDIVTGRSATTLSPSMQTFLAALHAVYGTIALLPRATFSSLSEAVTAGIVTGDVRAGMRALTAQIAGALGSPAGKERAELARATGIILANGGHDILAQRFGGTYGNDTRWDRLVGSMFRNSGLLALTNSQRTHMIAPAHAFLDNLAGHILEGEKARAQSGDGAPDTSSRAYKRSQEAIARLKELGIRDPEIFAREIRTSGRLPSVEDLETPYGHDWTTAVSRLVDQVIQNPNAMDRPEAASSPIGRIMYGIMSFNYAFYRNVLKGSAVRLWEQGRRSGGGFAAEHAILGLLPAFVALYVMQTTVSTLREYLTNRKRWNELEAKGEDALTDHMLRLGATRTFGTPVDPFVNAYTGLKYQRDFSNTLVGPAAGNILQSAQGVATYFQRNSENTNTAEYNAIKSLYALGVGPWGGVLVSALPGGPLTRAGYGLTTGYITSPVARDEAATAIVGEKEGRREAKRNPPSF